MWLDHSNAWSNSPQNFSNMADPTGTDGNISQDPVHLDMSGPTSLFWDLHLGVGSALVDAGVAGVSDPDGSSGDIGAYGGFGADGFDRDQDGFPDWWQPDPYDPATYPAMDLDCDDLDAALTPDWGC